MRRLLLPVMLLSAPLPLLAQSGPERATVDSLFAALAAAGTTGTLPDASRCAPYSGTLGRFCQQILNLARVDREPEEKLAYATEMAMRRVVDEQPKWATAWYVFGVARTQLPRAGITIREGVLQPLGNSAEAGAGNALVRALELEPDLLLAAEALAVVPMPRERAGVLGGRRDMLRKVRNTLSLSPAARMGVAIVEEEAGSPDTAVVMLGEAIAAGADSAAAMLDMARMLYKANRPADGHRVLLDGAGRTGTDRGNARYREELSWVASPGELVEWDSTAVAERPTWLGAFWADRDVRDGLADGQRLVEHYRRYEEALREFRVVIPQKGRQRLMSVSMAGDRMVLDAGDAAGMGGVLARSGASTGGAGIEAGERARAPISDFLQTVGAGSPFREFGISQDVLDDRGVIWIRHGKPTERTLTSGGTAMEGWRYARAPEPDLVLFFSEVDFDGQAGASVLVPTPAGMDGLVINQLCGNQKGMCDELIRFSKPEGALLEGDPGVRARLNNAAGFPTPPSVGRQATPTDVVNQERERGRQQIRRAVTTDDNRPAFDNLLQPVVQFYGLDAAAGGAPRLVLAFAIPGEKLVGTTPPAAGGRTVYPIRIRLIASVRGSPRRFDVDTTRYFAVAKPIGPGQFLSGTVEMPLPAGAYQATAVLTEGEDRGALSRLDEVRVPAATGGLAISSVVLGRQGTGVSWNSGRTVVPLNPLNAFAQKGEAELYYQLAGLEAGATLRTRVEFFKAVDGAEAKSALSLSYDDRAGDRRLEVQRTLNLKNLEPGRYRVRVSVTQGGATVSEAAFLTVVED